MSDRPICQMHIPFHTTAMHITLPFVGWLSIPRQDTESSCTCLSGRGNEEHCIQLKRWVEFRQIVFNNGPRIWPVTRNSCFALAKSPIAIILMFTRNQYLCFSSCLKNSNSYSTRQLKMLQCQSQGEKLCSSACGAAQPAHLARFDITVMFDCCLRNLSAVQTSRKTPSEGILPGGWWVCCSSETFPSLWVFQTRLEISS